jgi:hypothetical protein
MRLCSLARILPICGTAVANSRDANGLLAVGQLVEDPISADSQQIQPTQFASERMSGPWLALEQAQSILDRVDQRPIEVEQLPPYAAGKNEPRQRLAGGSSALSQLTAKFNKGDRLIACDLRQADLQGGECIWVGENLGGLLQCLVLVDRDQSRGRGAIASHKHVITPIADIVEQAAEVAA